MLRQVIDLHKDFKTEGADLGNILGLRDVTDADKIVDAMAKCKKAGGKVHIRLFMRRHWPHFVYARAVPLHRSHLDTLVRMFCIGCSVAVARVFPECAISG